MYTSYTVRSNKNAVCLYTYLNMCNSRVLHTYLRVHVLYISCIIHGTVAKKLCNWKIVGRENWNKWSVLLGHVWDVS